MLIGEILVITAGMLVLVLGGFLLGKGYAQRNTKMIAEGRELELVQMQFALPAAMYSPEGIQHATLETLRRMVPALLRYAEVYQTLLRDRAMRRRYTVALYVLKQKETAVVPPPEETRNQRQNQQLVTHLEATKNNGHGDTSRIILP